MPRKPIPSLNALRAFHAAAKHLNVGRAAQELFVSQGAVSKQLQSLESLVGVKLFERVSRGIRLTENGDALFACTRRVFTEIEHTVDRIGSVKTRQALHIAVSRSYATRVLAPRLKSFADAYPWIELHLDGNRHLADLHREEADAAIRVGDGNWPELLVESLGEETLFPVCSPALLSERTRGRIKTAEMFDFPLLHHAEMPYWQMWLHLVGILLPPHAKGIYFTETVTLLQAAEAGQGIAIARASLVQGELNRRILARPFAESMPDPLGYYFVATESAMQRRPVRLFRDWLMGGLPRQ